MTEYTARDPFGFVKCDIDSYVSIVKSISPLRKLWTTKAELDDSTKVNTEAQITGGHDGEVRLLSSRTVPDYEANVNSFGFMLPKTTVTKSNADKRLKIELPASQSVTAIDANEEATRLKWKWDTDHYEDDGFFQIDFDLALSRGTLFTFELLDKDGTVKLTKAVNVGGWIVPPAIYSYCGQEAGYPASNTRDGNIATEWRHLTDEAHSIVYDQGSSKSVGGVKIYYAATSGDWSVDVYVSDTPGVWGSPTISGWLISGGPGWKIAEWVPKTGRYIRIVIDSAHTTNYLYDFMEVQIYQLEHQTVAFKSLAWEMRLRCSTSGTSTGAEYADMRNIEISQFYKSGTLEITPPLLVANLEDHDYIEWSQYLPEGTNAKLQLAFSDNNINYSSFVGYDGTINTKYANITTKKITIPGGYTGYYVKWKAYLESDGRDTPVLYQLEIVATAHHYRRLLDWLESVAPQLFEYFTTISWKKGSVVDRSVISGNADFPDRLLSIAKNAVIQVYAPTLTGREFARRILPTLGSWLESVVGQVLSGYAKDQNGNIILNGIKVVITSTYAVGLDQLGTVDKSTGFCQVFVKNTKYDGRLLIVSLSDKTFDAVYRQYGTPTLIDGTIQVPSPQDLHFWNPNQICSKSIAFVGSLVTY